jgi:hypothetical protein
MPPWIRRTALLVCVTSLVTVLVRAADKPVAVEAKPTTTLTDAEKFPPPKWVKDAEKLKPASRPATRPIMAVERVMIISIDGLRPDLLLRGDMPNLHKLYRTGAYSFWARTTPNSITLPSHTSMLTGVDPRKHGIEWNTDLPLSVPFFPRHPTLFFYGKKMGYKTAMVAGKTKFDMLEVVNTLDASVIKDKKGDKDSDIAESAGQIIQKVKPDLMFVHFPGGDAAGHKYKWGSVEQMDALAAIDVALGNLLASARNAGTLAGTVVIVTADHGGAGNGHGPDDPRSRHIPWIANGPGVRAALDLNTSDETSIRTEDTFATACWLLNIPYAKIDGKPVESAFKGPAKELLSDVKK